MINKQKLTFKNKIIKDNFFNKIYISGKIKDFNIKTESEKIKSLNRYFRINNEFIPICKELKNLSYAAYYYNIKDGYFNLITSNNSGFWCESNMINLSSYESLNNYYGIGNYNLINKEIKKLLKDYDISLIY